MTRSTLKATMRRVYALLGLVLAISLFAKFVDHIAPLRGSGLEAILKDAYEFLRDMLIDPQTRVYEGMIVGQHTRDNDLIVNVIQGKKLTNIRAAGKDDALTLTPPLRLTLERALSYIQDDELVEVTPRSIRLRKRWLDPNERKKRERAREAQRETV